MSGNERAPRAGAAEDAGQVAAGDRAAAEGDRAAAVADPDAPVRAGRTAGPPIVATKLRPPSLPASYRDRPRLDALLDAALDDAVRLSLVSAPPGYGKTAAVAGWLRSRRLAHAWLTLDAADRDPARFVRYLVAAIRTVRPGIGDRSLSLVAAGTTPGPELLAATLLAELGDSDAPFALVLDDYHLVASAAIAGLVRLLVEQGPPFVHLVVLTREDPPLPLARLRAHGRLVELRPAALRYDDAEAEAYLRDGADLPLERRDVERLVERTEGWIAGLQLAAVSLRARADTAAAIDAFHGSNRFVLDYLADEVLARLDGDLRRFLVETSVADRFTADLCRALTGRPDAAVLLARAAQTNLYLVPLDDEDRWFRYHQLFADYLRTELDEPDRRSLHARAAAWFEAAGLADEAIRHALGAGDSRHAAALMDAAARGAFDAGELDTLFGWLEALPPADAVTLAPTLVSLAAWARFLAGQLPAAGQLAATALAALPPDLHGSEAEGRLMTVRALVAVLSSTESGPEAERLAEAGLERLGGDELFHSQALLTLGEIRLTAGELGRAIELFERAFVEAAGTGQPMAIFPVVYLLAVAENARGRRTEAEAMCRAVLDEYVDAAGRSLPIAGFARIALGILRYEANDLAEARSELERGFAAADVLGFGRFLLGQGAAVLAAVRAATGALEAAAEAARAGARHARSLGMAPVVPQSAATDAQLALARGDVAAAARWAGPAFADRAAAGRLIARVRFQHDLVLARVLVATGRHGDALEVLDDLVEVVRRGDAVAFEVSAATVEAAARLAGGDEPGARAALGRAVDLGSPGWYVRRVVEDAASLAPLLPAVRDRAPEFVDAVLAGLGEPDRAPAHAGQTRARAAGSMASDGPAPAAEPLAPLAALVEPLVEPLTPRELDVLRLLADGRSNAAIAEALVVSLATAKWHVGHVLGKLGATSRTEAVVRAQRLGLV